MAESERKTFPMLPESHWWKLRERFKSSIPGVVTDSYLASVLNIQKNSAQANVLPALKQINLIDDDGKTSEIAKEWRDDHKYPDVCKKIAKSIYPQELFDAFPNPSQDREGLKRWFAHITGTGDVAVGKMVALFLLITEANPQNSTTISKTKSEKSKPVVKATKGTVTKQKSVEQTGKQEIPTKEKPDININLQIHISSDATPDQIDKIFESMSRHIYKER
jgi:hypothetical protein